MHPLIAYELLNEKTRRGRKVITFKDPLREGYLIGEFNKIELPCGQCRECRLAYRQHWRTRLILEKKNWKYAYFITLTYDNEHEHYVTGVNTITGELENISTLDKKDMQLFLKSYRKPSDGSRKGIKHDFGKVKYFQCGEYGDMSSRRHHHIIIYQDKPITDLKFLKLTRDKNTLWTSETVDNIWGRGICFIGEVTRASAGYVARYVMKKQKGEGAKIYDQLGIVPEYVSMSNGLGMDYFNENWQKIFRNDEIIYSTGTGKVRTVKPPRAYDEKLFELDPERFQEIKDARRRTAIANRNVKQSQTERKDWAIVEHNTKMEKIKLLKRSDI